MANEKKKLKDEELKKVNGGVEIVNKESDNNDLERDLNRLNTICQRRDTGTIDSMNLMQKLVDNNSEIKASE